MKKFVQTCRNVLASKKTHTAAGLALLMTAYENAMAAADITAITAAQTDLLAYAAAMLTLGIAVWAALKAVRMFHGR